MLLNQVNSDPRLAGKVDVPTSGAAAPVMATPSVLTAVCAVGAAKAAGAVVGAGAVTGAAYAAYRTVAN